MSDLTILDLTDRPAIDGERVEKGYGVRIELPQHSVPVVPNTARAVRPKPPPEAWLIKWTGRKWEKVRKINPSAQVQGVRNGDGAYVEFQDGQGSISTSRPSIPRP